MDRVGDWIQTYTGKRFWPLDPRAEEIDIEDIAHSLSMTCRYGGHSEHFYSVSEHSVLVSYFVPKEYALWGLLHDAPEAYSADIPRPLKKNIPAWYPMEEKLMHSICERFGLEKQEPPIVKKIDLSICIDEYDVLMKKTEKWSLDGEKLGAAIRCLSPNQAKIEFLYRFHELTNIQKEPRIIRIVR